MTRFILIISLVCLLESSGSAQCLTDWNGDGATTIDEVVRAVRDALHGCGGQDTPGRIFIYASTDRHRYRVGETARLVVRLVSEEPTSWSSEFLPNSPLATCILDVRITNGHFSEERLLYERSQDDDSYRGCSLLLGSRLRTVKVPPALEIAVGVPLVEKLRDVEETPLAPGIYYLEGRLRLALMPGGRTVFPSAPHMKAGVQIEIYE